MVRPRPSHRRISSRPPTQLRLARTHGTHETEIDFPVGGVSVSRSDPPLNLRYMCACARACPPLYRNLFQNFKKIGGWGVRSQWNGDPHREIEFRVRARAVRAVRAGEAKLRGRARGHHPAVARGPATQMFPPPVGPRWLDRLPGCPQDITLLLLGSGVGPRWPDRLPGVHGCSVAHRVAGDPATQMIRRPVAHRLLLAWWLP